MHTSMHTIVSVHIIHGIYTYKWYCIRIGIHYSYSCWLMFEQDKNKTTVVVV